MRARRLGHALNHAAVKGLMSAPVTAAAVRTPLRAGHVAWAWQMLWQGRDHLALILSEDDQVLLDSWEAAPASTGTRPWDVLLAAVIAHEFTQARHQAPAWTEQEATRRALDSSPPVPEPRPRQGPDARVAQRASTSTYPIATC